MAALRGDRRAFRVQAVKVRVIVPAYNEEALLPHFLSHYLSIADSILLYDNGSTDKTAALALEFPRTEVRWFKTDGYDELDTLGVLEDARRESAGAFDWCLFPDVDEFLFHPQGVRRILRTIQTDLLFARGLSMVQGPGEAPLDLKRPLFAQRRWGFPNAAYSKPVGVRPETPGRFMAGKHAFESTQSLTRSEPAALFTFHVDQIDYDLWVYRKTRRPLSRRNVEKGYCTKRFCREPAFYRTEWEAAQMRARKLEVLP